ncbi:hypothetical protein [Pseudomonas kribbensis]|uniref:hypothetical protein n=1 Tax=Pseudomonas kribbensis TaxID=1628086 RepID=UPI0013B41176|nr:hypothetical protein [Pseudomonas kribbensis]
MTSNSNTQKIQNESPELIFPMGVGFDFLNPDPNFIMSYDRNGLPRSRFGQDQWNYNSYNLRSTQNSIAKFDDNFNNKAIDQEKLIVQHKLILAAVQFSAFASWFDTPSSATMMSTHRVMGIVIKFCVQNKKYPFDVLTSTELITHLSKNMKEGEKSLLRGLLKKLVRANVNNFGASFSLDTLLPILSGKRSESRQHPVIPSRILFERLKVYSEIIYDYLNNEVNIKKITHLSWLCHSYLVGADFKYEVPTGVMKSNQAFQRVSLELGLNELMEKYKIDSITQFSRFLGQVQYASMMTILTYSGMRYSEALSLKYNCLKIKKKKYGKIRRLIGITTKFSRKRYETSWVTSKEIEPAVNAAKSIARICLTSLNLNETEIETIPLFISRKYNSFSQQNYSLIEKNPGHYETAKLIPLVWEPFFRQTFIEEEDLYELKDVAPFQDWSADDRYSVGASWPITCHQLRRSLAVYAARSGLVRHSSLRRQLKHLSVEMSLYYARGSSRAKSIFSPDAHHIIHDFTPEKLSELDSIIYIRDILNSKESIYDGFGKKNRNIQSISNKNISMEEKTIILQDFTNGLKAYRPTPVGGCTSISGCSKSAHLSMTTCVQGCPEAAIKPSNLKHAIDTGNRLISSLEINSVEYRTEIAQLEDLNRIYLEITA